MFGEFTVSAEMHDAVYFDLLDAGFEEVDFPSRTEYETVEDFDLM